MMNRGNLIGGSGAPQGEQAFAGQGGVGLMVNGNSNSIVNFGSIAGGWDGYHDAQNDAVVMAGDNNNIVLVEGSDTAGAIRSLGSNNLLSVAGVGTTSSEIDGFSQINAYAADGSAWTFTNSVFGRGNTVFDIAANNRINIDGVFYGGSVQPALRSVDAGLTKTGEGVLEIQRSKYRGTTNVQGGVLILHNGPTGNYAIGVGGTLDLAGTELTMTGLVGAGFIVGSPNLTLDQEGDSTFGGNIIVDNFTKLQGGTLTVLGTLSANTAIEGVLQIGEGGTYGELDGNVSHASEASASLAFDRADTVVYKGDASVQRLAQIGSGTLVLAGNNSTQLIDVSYGTLLAGSQGALGHATVSLFDGSTFAFGGNQAFANTFVLRGNTAFNVAEGDTGTLQGELADGISAASLYKNGHGTLVIDGELEAKGLTVLNEGTLVVGSAAGSEAKIDGGVVTSAGTTIGGFGTIGAGLSVIGGTVAPGMDQIGVLNVGSLGLMNAHVAIDIGAPGISDRIDVAGNANFSNSVVDVNNLGGMGLGVYRILTVGGTASATNQLSLGDTPTGSNLTLRYLADANAFDLINQGNLTLNYWNADGLGSATHAGGGTGIWSKQAATFSDAQGQQTGAMNPQPGFAIFGGAAGNVTVIGDAGDVAATGMQFMTDGYHLRGAVLKLVGDEGAAPVIRVGDGSAAGAAMTATIDNSLMGSDGLRKTDAGTLVLTGANTFTGGVTVNGGTLAVGADANLGDASNVVTLDGGTLHFTGGEITQRNYLLGGNNGTVNVDIAYSVGGAVGGKGALRKAGNGTLTLSGDNSYTGGTWLDAGKLVANSDHAIGSGDLHMAENTVLGFAKDGVKFANRIIVNGDPTIDVATGTTATVSGAIVDGATPGDIVKTGTGTLRLTAANTYTGGTAVSQGNLIVGDGATAGSIVGNVAIKSAGTLTFDRSDAISFAGAISGEGTVVKLGGNTLTLTGDSSAFTGTTQVAGGVLNLTGSLGGSLVLAQNAVLTGAGKLGQVTVNSGTSMTPGGDAAIGRFDVAGNLAFANGSTYVVNTAPDGTSDTVTATGSATLGGATVRSLQGTGNYLPQTRYTILTASGGVQGTFGTLTSDLAFLTPTLSYDANHVYLDLLRNDTSFRSLALNANQVATADAIESQGSGVSVYDAVVALQAADVPPALGQLAGVSLASARTAMVDDARQVRETVQRHLLGTGEGQSANGAWASAWGHWGDRDGSAGVDRLRSNGGGLLVGADREISGVTLGGTVGTGNLTARSGNDSVQGHSRVAGLYAAGAAGAFEWQAGAMYGWNRLESHRRVGVDGLAGNASARYDATTAQAYLDGGYRFTFARGSLMPFVNVARVQLKQDAIHERNSDAALDVQGQDDGVTVGSAGLRGTLALGEGISAHATLAYQQAWGDVRPYDTQRFAVGGDAFTVAGAPLARHAGLADAGFTFAVARNTTVSASYHGLFGGGAKDQGARMALEVKW